MSTLVPNRLLFRFEFPLRYRKTARIDGDLDSWSDEFLVPDLGPLDGEKSFGNIWLAWNETGLFVACRVKGRRSPFRCSAQRFWEGDNLRLMTDMRDTRDVKRASRYCQQFYFLPSGGGSNGKAPCAGAARIHRAREHAPPVPEGGIQIAGRRRGGTYTMEAHIPSSVLSGFDPEEHPRLGIFTILEDVDLGQQYLTVGDELNWHIDPSTWATAMMTGK